MRRKGYAKGTFATGTDIDRTLVGSCAILAVLVWLAVAAENTRSPVGKMGRCGDPGVMCLSDLAYAPHKESHPGNEPCGHAAAQCLSSLDSPPEKLLTTPDDQAAAQRASVAAVATPFADAP